MSSLYIDADNISYKNIEELVKKDFKSFIIKKIYGDWSKTELKNWSKKVIEYGFEPIQCFRTNKKQTTDIRLITDIINDIYTNDNIKKIYLATSDIDFSYVCILVKKKNIEIEILSNHKSNLNNFEYDGQQKDYIDDNDQILSTESESYSESDSDKTNSIELDKFIKVMNENNIILISKFKKELKKIDDNFKMKNLDERIKCYPGYFKIIKKNNRTYILYLYEFFKYNKKDFIKNKIKIESKNKNILSVIKFDDLFKLLF